MTKFPTPRYIPRHHSRDLAVIPELVAGSSPVVLGMLNLIPNEALSSTALFPLKQGFHRLYTP